MSEPLVFVFTLSVCENKWWTKCHFFSRCSCCMTLPRSLSLLFDTAAFYFERLALNRAEKMKNEEKQRQHTHTKLTIGEKHSNTYSHVYYAFWTRTNFRFCYFNSGDCEFDTLIVGNNERRAMLILSCSCVRSAYAILVHDKRNNVKNLFKWFLLCFVTLPIAEKRKPKCRTWKMFGIKYARSNLCSSAHTQTIDRFVKQREKIMTKDQTYLLNDTLEKCRKL